METKIIKIGGEIKTNYKRKAELEEQLIKVNKEIKATKLASLDQLNKLKGLLKPHSPNKPKDSTDEKPKSQDPQPDEDIDEDELRKGNDDALSELKSVLDNLDSQKEQQKNDHE